MKHLKLVLVLLLAVSLSPCAKANVISIGTLANTNYLLGVIPGGAFSDIYQFTLSTASNITDVFNPVFGVNNFGFTPTDLTTSTGFGSHSSYSSLNPGTYDFTFTGTVP